MSEDAPVIGIAMDVAEPKPGRLRAECGMAYAECVLAAGGVPLYLPPLPALIPRFLEECDGFVLTGGDDPKMERYGAVTDPRTTSVHPRRQNFEEQLIETVLDRPQIPVLGVCLGMQMLALASGGTLDQYLPATLPSADDHRGDKLHRVEPVNGHWLPGGMVASSHKQAVADPGRMTVAARSHDGVVEAIERPGGFCLGVQWHPERTPEPALGQDLFNRLIAAARQWRGVRRSRSR